MAVKNRKLASAVRAAVRYRKRSRGIPADPLVIKLVICLGIFLMVLVVKAFGNGPLAGVKETISRYIGSGADYKEAIAVIGRAVVERDSLARVMEEEAIKVFGTNLILPIPEDGEEKESTQTSAGVTPPAGRTAGEDDPDGADPNDWEHSAEPPPGDENVTDAMQEGYIDEAEENRQFLAETGEDALFPSFSDILEGSASEPIIVRNPLDLIEQSVIPEEVIDNTPATEFEIPSPDQVDDKVHSLPFKYASPAKGTVTSAFGYRTNPITKETNFHYGVDVGLPLGAAVKSFAAGTVTETGTGKIYGKYVKVDHGGGYWTRYCHLNKISVKKGSKVKLGTKIGEAGTTGQSTGVHLHFEVRYNDRILNPSDYVSFK